MYFVSLNKLQRLFSPRKGIPVGPFDLTVNYQVKSKALVLCFVLFQYVWVRVKENVTLNKLMIGRFPFASSINLVL